MAEIVFAAGAPHAPGLVGLYDTAPADVQDVVKSTYDRVGDELRAARPDLLLVFANDHLANSRISAYPDFLVGLAPEHRGPDPWFKPWIGCRDYVVRGDTAAAEALVNGLAHRGVRMCFERNNLRFDDNLSVPVTLMDLDRSSMAVVPILQNCTVPPIPDQRRCYEIGQSVAAFIREDLPAGMRVALLGSGGLSHEPGGSRYYFIDEDFDHWFLELCASGDHERLLRELTLERMDASGAGGTSELLAWVVVMGAIGPRAGRNLGYALHRDFKCGIGAVIWDLDRAAAPAPRTRT